MSVVSGGLPSEGLGRDIVTEENGWREILT